MSYNKSDPVAIWKPIDTLSVDIATIAVTETIHDPYALGDSPLDIVGQNKTTKDVTKRYDINGIFCQTAGSYTLMGKDGVEQAFDLLAGVVYPFSPSQVTAGTTSGLYGLYG